MIANRPEMGVERPFDAALAIYESVFGEAPDAEVRHFSDGTPYLVVAGWLWLYQARRGLLWAVRPKIPDDPWYARYPCLRKLHEEDVFRQSLVDAVHVLVDLETHRRFHLAVESAC